MRHDKENKQHQEDQATDQFVHKAMNSLDGIEMADPGPFFYTRVRSSLENQHKSNDGLDWFNRLYSSNWSVAAAGLILIINLGVILFNYNSQSLPLTQSSSTEVLIDDYQLDYNTLYSYLDE